MLLLIIVILTLKCHKEAPLLDGGFILIVKRSFCALEMNIVVKHFKLAPARLGRVEVQDHLLNITSALPSPQIVVMAPACAPAFGHNGSVTRALLAQFLR